MISIKNLLSQIKIFLLTLLHLSELYTFISFNKKKKNKHDISSGCQHQTGSVFFFSPCVPLLRASKILKVRETWCVGKRQRSFAPRLGVIISPHLFMTEKERNLKIKLGSSRIHSIPPCHERHSAQLPWWEELWTTVPNLNHLPRAVHRAHKHTSKGT